MLDCESLHLRHCPTIFTITSTGPTILIDCQTYPTEFGPASARGMLAGRIVLTDHLAFGTGTVMWSLD